jgi:hypothetical protein
VLNCEENWFKELCFGWDWKGWWGRGYVVGEEGGHLVFFFVYLGEFNCVWGFIQ